MIDLEKIAAEVHKAYCDNYLERKGKPYHTGGDFNLLDDETKEIDRATVRAVLQQVLFALEDSLPNEGHHPDLMCQVVKNNKFAGNGKNGLWQILLFRRALWQPFPLPDHVVVAVPHKPPVKRGDQVRFHRLEPPADLPQDKQGIRDVTDRFFLP